MTSKRERKRKRDVCDVRDKLNTKYHKHMKYFNNSSESRVRSAYAHTCLFTAKTNNIDTIMSNKTS